MKLNPSCKLKNEERGIHGIFCIDLINIENILAGALTIERWCGSWEYHE
jgi:hypothetical protein